MGKMMFTLVSAIAEFERALIRERVLAGLQRARGQGKKLGRPLLAPLQSPEALKAAGLSVRAIAAKLGVSKSWVASALSKNPPRNPGGVSLGTAG
jgi:DNA invertase Pin-like site-specific DNA recombinase